MPDPEQRVVRAVILGNDALLAARPAAPLQLLNACARAGFDFVAPVSWGEELLAMRAGKWVGQHSPVSAIVAHCPYVAEALRATTPTDAVCLTGVAPPVAAARYLRAVFAPRPLHIVYSGACPGASGPDIDEVLLPDVLLARFADARIVVSEQPAELDSRLPPERARHASLPGGAPAPAWLGAVIGATALEVAPVTLAAAPRAAAADAVVLDLHAACRCACAEDRPDVARLEPPRAPKPVVVEAVAVDLEDGPDLGGWRVAGPVRDGSATAVAGEALGTPLSRPAVAFAPRGLGGPREESSGPAALGSLTAVLEPWLEPPAPLRGGLARSGAAGQAGRQPGPRDSAVQQDNGAERSDIGGAPGTPPRSAGAEARP
jgi:hypothetical protein